MMSLTEKIINGIKQYFVDTNGKIAIIGISGGKDSTVTAALCAKALGKENVIGILMPNKQQNDINDAISICEFLNIKYYKFDIFNAYNAIFTKLIENGIEPTNQTKLNLPPRLRMTTLYAIAQSYSNARVINTTNACEAFVGYGTLFGDTVGDFAPLKMLTVDDIYEIGDELGLPKELVYKTPADGLTGKPDEEILGVSYSDIGEFYKKYIKNGWKDCIINSDKFKMSKEAFEKIKELHLKNKFKSEMLNIPCPKI